MHRSLSYFLKNALISIHRLYRSHILLPSLIFLQESTDLKFESKGYSVFIQTDKAIYRWVAELQRGRLPMITCHYTSESFNFYIVFTTGRETRCSFEPLYSLLNWSHPLQVRKGFKFCFVISLFLTKVSPYCCLSFNNLFKSKEWKSTFVHKYTEKLHTAHSAQAWIRKRTIHY